MLRWTLEYCHTAKTFLQGYMAGDAVKGRKKRTHTHTPKCGHSSRVPALSNHFLPWQPAIWQAKVSAPPAMSLLLLYCLCSLTLTHCLPLPLSFNSMLARHKIPWEHNRGLTGSSRVLKTLFTQYFPCTTIVIWLLQLRDPNGKCWAHGSNFFFFLNSLQAILCLKGE